MLNAPSFGCRAMFQHIVCSTSIHYLSGSVYDHTDLSLILFVGGALNASHTAVFIFLYRCEWHEHIYMKVRWLSVVGTCARHGLSGTILLKYNEPRSHEFFSSSLSKGSMKYQQNRRDEYGQKWRLSADRCPTFCEYGAVHDLVQ